MAEHEHKHALRRFIAERGASFLADPNVTSIGIGRRGNAPDGPIAVVFTVETKAPRAALPALRTAELPPSLTIDGVEFPTDVLAARYTATPRSPAPEPPGSRALRHDPVRPGISVGQASRSSGTIGAIVFDEESGLPCILSNWHVLHTDRGLPASDRVIGSAIHQPSWREAGPRADSLAGMLLRGVIGEAGDGALALLTHRGHERAICGLGIIPRRLADVDLGDRLVKSGRATGVTHGRVRRVDVRVKIDFGLARGPVIVGGFEIAPDPVRLPASGEISAPGDSGALWMMHEDGAASDIVAGLHCAGEQTGNADEHAIACYPQPLMKALRFTLEPPQNG